MRKRRGDYFFTVMTLDTVSSWGRVVRAAHRVVAVRDRGESVLDELRGSGASVLPIGNGRSYGDSCLNPGGVLLDTRTMNAIIGFDIESGVVTCEAGTLLSDITACCLPHGWFLPVTPGTQFVTIGGAIANDVHGKNHHRAGSIGNHVTRFELLRSDGHRMICSPTENADWFAATIGGLGLTGLITWASIELRRVPNAYIDSETLRFRSLEEFFALSEASASDFEHSVAWIDCAYGGRRLGRGLFMRGNHAAAGLDKSKIPRSQSRHEQVRFRSVPFVPPFSLVNSLSLKAFNAAYFHRQRGDHVSSIQHFRPFFYPLDSLLDWNRIYGPRGFYQYQCVLPPDRAARDVRRLLEAIAASGMGSFLAVLKQFGDMPSRGMLSFPMAGVTLALDFPNRGAALHALFERLDRIVVDAGGRLYPAKDARMSAAVFKSGHPRWQEFLRYVDPRFSSGLWCRVMGAGN